MEILTVIIGYIPYIVVLLVLIGGTVAIVANEKKNIKQWLLLAVTEAEKALGGGVGALKLRNVFEQFVKLYPTFSKFVTFETFSSWVDLSLEKMKKMLESNKKIEEYVTGETETK